jgi:hypothetical protein
MKEKKMEIIEVSRNEQINLNIKKDFEDWSKKLTSKESTALYLYTDYLFKYINFYMRNDKMLNEKFTKQDLDHSISNITSALNKGVIKRDCILYRGVDMSLVKKIFKMDNAYHRKDLMKNLLEGKVFGVTFQDKAFLSTSLEPTVADYFSMQGAKEKISFVFKIKVQRGVLGGYLQKNSIRNREEEILLMPNQKIFFEKAEVLKLLQNERVVISCRLI